MTEMCIEEIFSDVNPETVVKANEIIHKAILKYLEDVKLRMIKDTNYLKGPFSIASVQILINEQKQRLGESNGKLSWYKNKKRVYV